MAKQPKRTNPIVLRSGTSVGSAAAEADDEFLFSSFVHYPPVAVCRDVKSPAMIISGRTGAGKTAILRHIQSEEEHVFDLNPVDLSIDYISNSDALNFLRAIGADLDLLFQMLWRHVLCIEYVRLRWNVGDKTKSSLVFQTFNDRFFGNEKKQRALAYLEKWQGQFWIPIDENVKSLTENIEQKAKAEFGADIEKFKMGGQYDKRLSTEKKD